MLPTSIASSIARLSSRMSGSDRDAADAKLYVIPASHPVADGDDDARRQGIPYKRVDLMPVIAKGALRALGFPGITVPALKIDGRKVQGSREIARELDRIKPDPPLLPADPAARAAVEQAERLGRRGAPAGRPPDPLERAAARPRAARLLLRGRAARRSDRARREDRPAAGRRSRPGSTRPTDENVRADLAALPGMLQRSTTGSPTARSAASSSNAADLQIATSVRLLMTLQDLRDADRRPAGRRARDARRAGLRGRRAADPAARVARAAAG